MLSWGRREFGKTYEIWPRTADGQTEEPAFLVHCSPLDMEADMIQSMLGSFHIPSIRRLPGDGAFGELILGMSGNGVDLYVPKSMLEDAKALLEGETDDDGIQE